MTGPAQPTELVDLAARRLGGLVMAANDEYFAPKERLLDPSPPLATPGRFTDRGALMDGWETRRRREPGSDWCVVRLGLPGVVFQVVVDTTHFKGNAPAACTLEGCALEGDPTAAELLAAGPGRAPLDPEPPAAGWVPLVEHALQPDRLQTLPVSGAPRVTHVRLVIHPDGGVARLRVLGEPLPDLRRVVLGGRADLASVASGGVALAASEEFFSSRHHLVMVGDPTDMGDGWETRRRRDDGADWVIVRLAAAGLIDRVEIDTSHFTGNHPDRCSVEVCDAPGADLAALTAEGTGWQPLLGSTRLGPHRRHVVDVEPPGPATHARLTILPDGGVGRLRLWGTVTDDGWRAWGLRWLNALTAAEAGAELTRCCGSARWVAGMVARRPWPGFAALLAAADEVWDGLARDDWREALAAHPPIGERRAEVHSSWTRQEQASAVDPTAATAEALVAGNAAYEQRFGATFVICATGRGAPEILAELERRLGNDDATELGEAAAEQAAITRLRLEKLVRP